MSPTVGVLAEPLAAHVGGGRFARAIVWKANPRPAAYMRARFAEAAPDGRVVEAGEALAPALRDAGTVVLLYPDAIGLGWRPVERVVRRAAPTGAAIEVLNGRRRRFALDRRTARALTVRRVLEWTMLGELLAAPVVVGAAAALAAVDLLRGRR
jgi:hypothetical protein